MKILVLQKSTVDAEELDATLTDAQQSDKSGRDVDLVVLPEGALSEAGEPTCAGNAELRELCAVVAKHRCWAVLGTMTEIDTATDASTTGHTASENKYYTTAVVVDPDGNVAHTYRKRAIPSDDGTFSAGTKVGVFKTEWGNVGVLICYDSEDDGIVQELLDIDPVLVVNPIHISAGRTGGAGGGTEQALAKWRVACDSMSRRMDYLVATSKRCCGWVRTDQPYPIGLGSSMVVGRFETQYVPVMTDAIWPVEIPLDPRQVLVAPPPRRSRTDKWDNCGTRYTRRSVALPAKADGVVPVSCMFVEAGDAKGAGPGQTGKLNVLFSDGSHISVDISRLRAEQGETSMPSDGKQCKAHEKLHQLLQERLATSQPGREHVLGSDFAVPVPLDPTVADTKEHNRQGFYLHSSPVSSGLLQLCRWEKHGAGQLKTEFHHTFQAGPLGASAFAYDERRGRLAMVSATPLRTLTREPRLRRVQTNQTPVASLGIARHRFVASILTISQHRQELSLSELLA
jgi:predicted amidohydrolase